MGITKPILTDETFGEKLDTANGILQQIAAGLPGSPAQLDATYTGLIDGRNTTHLFRLWWPQSDNGRDSRYRRLCRWFGILANAWQDKTYTLRWYLHSVSGDPVMTPLDDLAGYEHPADLATDTTTTYAEDWATDDPMTWYIRANALSLADGSMDVLAIEGEDGFDLGGDIAPVYTFTILWWVKEWDDGANYNYRSWATVRKDGFRPFEVGMDNNPRPMCWHSSFGGSLTTGNKLTSGAGKKPATSVSADAGIGYARNMSAHEGLMGDLDSLHLLWSWQLRHWNLENSGILEGCISYDVRSSPAVAETGVERVILSNADAAGYIEGSTVQLSTAVRSGTVTCLARILRKVGVTISDAEYTALYLDNGGATFDTTSDLILSTMPWHTGDTEAVQGHRDGSRGSLTSGKCPMRVGGVECMAGCYDIGLDPLYNVTENTDGGFDYAVYEVRDSAKQGSSIGANHIDTGITGTGDTTDWNYVKAFVRNDIGILFPENLGGNSNNWYKSAFAATNSAGVRCPWRRGRLYNGASAGLAGEVSTNSPAGAAWHSSPRLAGSGKKRGEWAV